MMIPPFDAATSKLAVDFDVSADWYARHRLTTSALIDATPFASRTGRRRQEADGDQYLSSAYVRMIEP